MRDHTKLKAFELADEVAVLVYRVTTGFPNKFRVIEGTALSAKFVQTFGILAQPGFISA